MQRSLLRTLGLVLFEAALIFSILVATAWVRLNDEEWAAFIFQYGIAKSCAYFSIELRACRFVPTKQTSFPSATTR